jgi:hypothetical protein
VVVNLLEVGVLHLLSHFNLPLIIFVVQDKALVGKS